MISNIIITDTTIIKVPISPKQRKISTDPEAETTQGEKAESQSQPKKGVAITERG